jgi:hypothetical protein
VKIVVRRELRKGNAYIRAQTPASVVVAVPEQTSDRDGRSNRPPQAGVCRTDLEPSFASVTKVPNADTSILLCTLSENGSALAPNTCGASAIPIGAGIVDSA